MPGTLELDGGTAAAIIDRTLAKVPHAELEQGRVESVLALSNQVIVRFDTPAPDGSPAIHTVDAIGILPSAGDRVWTIYMPPSGYYCLGATVDSSTFGGGGDGGPVHHDDSAYIALTGDGTPGDLLVATLDYGGLATALATTLDAVFATDAALAAAVSGLAVDTAVVHNTGNESVAGIKTFTSPIVSSGASLSAGTVPLNAMATVADQRFMGNISGGAASAIGLTAAQVKGALAITAGDLAAISDLRVLGNVSGASAPPTALTPANVATILSQGVTISDLGLTRPTTTDAYYAAQTGTAHSPADTAPDKRWGSPIFADFGGTTIPDGGYLQSPNTGFGSRAAVQVEGLVSITGELASGAQLFAGIQNQIHFRADTGAPAGGRVFGTIGSFTSAVIVNAGNFGTSGSPLHFNATSDYAPKLVGGLWHGTVYAANAGYLHADCYDTAWESIVFVGDHVVLDTRYGGLVDEASLTGSATGLIQQQVGLRIATLTAAAQNAAIVYGTGDYYTPAGRPNFMVKSLGGIVASTGSVGGAAQATFIGRDQAATMRLLRVPAATWNTTVHSAMAGSTIASLGANFALRVASLTGVTAPGYAVVQSNIADVYWYITFTGTSTSGGNFLTGCNAVAGYGSTTALATGGTVSDATTGVVSGNVLGAIEFQGWNGAGGAAQIGGRIRVTATENYDATHGGAKMLLAVTANGATAPTTALTLDQDASATFAAGITSTTAHHTGAVTADTSIEVFGAALLHSTLDVTGILTSNGATQLNSTLDVLGASTLHGAVTETVFATSATYDLRRANGTGTTAVSSGNALGVLRGYGYDGTAYGLAASIGLTAAEGFSGTAHGGRITLNTQTTGGAAGTTERVRVEDAFVEIVGQLGVGNAAGTAPTARLETTGAATGEEIFRMWSTDANVTPRTVVRQGSTQTTNATAKSMLGITVNVSGTTTQIVAMVAAHRTGGAAGSADDGASYLLMATYKNGAQIGTTTVIASHESVGAYDATLDFSGSNGRVVVTGVANTNIDWDCTCWVTTCA